MRLGLSHIRSTTHSRCTGDENRWIVLEALRNGRTVTELAGMLPIARPGFSRHLWVLQEAGLVEAHPDAQWLVYRLRVEPPVELDAWLGRHRALSQQRMHALDTE